MADSIGRLVDRLSILEVDRYRIRHLLAEPDLTSQERTVCESRMGALEAERMAVTGRINLLWASIVGV